MTSSKKLSIIIFSIILLTITIFVLIKQFNDKNSFVLKTNKNETGWGYDIYSKGKLIIHQPIIPAIKGNKSFSTKNDAKRIGKFVIKKLKSGKSPTIKLLELDSLNINLKESY